MKIGSEIENLCGCSIYVLLCFSRTVIPLSRGLPMPLLCGHVRDGLKLVVMGHFQLQPYDLSTKLAMYQAVTTTQQQLQF